MRVKSVVLTSLVLVATLRALAPTTVSAQSYAIQGLDRFFRVESTSAPGSRGPVVSGYVYNIYGHTADHVRLIIESVDGAGQVTASKLVALVGTIGPGDRAYFQAVAPREGSSYRVRVASYDPIGRGQ